MLTPTQVSWLTVAQVQSLHVRGFPIPAAEPDAVANAGSDRNDSGPRAVRRVDADVPCGAHGGRRSGTSTSVKIGLSLLTPQQVSWLLRSQIQSLHRHDFKYLPPFQIPDAHAAQIASILGTRAIRRMDAAARTAPQRRPISALGGRTTGHLGLAHAATGGLSHGGAGSGRSRSTTLSTCRPARRPCLTPAQIATIPDPGPFAEWSAAARAALTLAQVRALDVAPCGSACSRRAADRLVQSDSDRVAALGRHRLLVGSADSATSRPLSSRVSRRGFLRAFRDDVEVQFSRGQAAGACRSK